MKIAKKLMTGLLLAATLLTACFAFTACGTAKISGVYLSPAQMGYINMRPQEMGGYEYYLTTFTQQELTLFEDGTYCMLVSSSTFSAIELDEDTQSAKGNEQTNSIYKYYGKCTTAVNSLDSELLDATLAKPTRVVLSYNSEYYFDTDSWTESMGKQAVPGKIDSSTGQTIKDPNATPWTAAQYLESVAFDEVKIALNTKKYSFSFTTLTVTKA